MTDRVIVCYPTGSRASISPSVKIMDLASNRLLSILEPLNKSEPQLLQESVHNKQRQPELVDPAETVILVRLPSSIK